MENHGSAFFMGLALPNENPPSRPQVTISIVPKGHHTYSLFTITYSLQKSTPEIGKSE